METKFVVVLGSLLSGLGKGIVTSSIAKILSFYNLNAMPMKFDGYLNYDCGTMNPFRHGEVFVLEDGSEVDMDFGTYERFLNRNMNGAFSMTGGKIFSEIIAKERSGGFLGSDVQIVPHLTNMIIEKVERLAKNENLDVLLVETGGTVGDIENSYFVEAMRQLALKRKVVFIDLTYVPELETVGEQKTKPSQIALRGLRQEGIQPDFIICRANRKLDEKTRDKLALFANLQREYVIDDNDVSDIYGMPQYFMKQNFDKLLLNRLGLEGKAIDEKLVAKWDDCITNKSQNRPITISIVGKYVNLHDSYASVTEALKHAAVANGTNIKLNWLESEALEGMDEAMVDDILSKSDGILVPGGFGKRGTEGMISAIRYARVKGVPYLGLCLGMQLMVIEYARDVCGIKDAGSMEFDSACSNVIDMMEEQKKVERLGGTMRLGGWSAVIRPGTASHSAYGTTDINERHRHRYEVNNAYLKTFEEMNLVISAMAKNNNLVEMTEWKSHFGIGTQAHPEFKSRPENPSPLFKAFIKSAVERASSHEERESIKVST
ncbi:MAG: CTP synthase [Candidatus Marsarchaeota archaeon]|nr:CTP synthase [Candidatus Marsarchaeota archaeon]